VIFRYDAIMAAIPEDLIETWPANRLPLRISLITLILNELPHESKPPSNAEVHSVQPKNSSRNPRMARNTRIANALEKIPFHPEG